MRTGILIFYIMTGLLSQAQVPVSKEPRHHPVFENSKVRILNVLLPPGDTTQYHVHSTPSVFIILSKTRTGSQLLNQQAGPSGLPDIGNIYFENLSTPHTRIHRVWNMDTSTFHVMDIELLAKEPGFTQKPLVAKYLQLQTDTEWARIYKIELPAKENLPIHEAQRSFVLVAIKDEQLRLVINKKESTLFLPAGKFFWLNPGDEFTLHNSQAQAAMLALIEVK